MSPIVSVRRRRRERVDAIVLQVSQSNDVPARESARSARASSSGHLRGVRDAIACADAFLPRDAPLRPRGVASVAMIPSTSFPRARAREASWRRTRCPRARAWLNRIITRRRAHRARRRRGPTSAPRRRIARATETRSRHRSAPVTGDARRRTGRRRRFHRPLSRETRCDASRGERGPERAPPVAQRALTKFLDLPAVPIGAFVSSPTSPLHRTDAVKRAWTDDAFLPGPAKRLRRIN